MIWAASYGHLSVVTYLCENGADVNVQNIVSNFIILTITYLIIMINRMETQL
jgi:ankyrin repeat protein